MRSERFEKWYAQCTGLHHSEVRDMHDGKTYASCSYQVEMAWAAWCAALGLELAE